jgi:hypothetical protein
MILTWGQSTAKAWQGWARWDGQRWSAHWSVFWNTLERDGPITHRGRDCWVSEGGGSISMGCAVMDDFGTLVPAVR